MQYIQPADAPGIHGAQAPPQLPVVHLKLGQLVIIVVFFSASLHAYVYSSTAGSGRRAGWGEEKDNMEGIDVHKGR